MRRIGACAALVAALALPATASAEKLMLEGKVKGVPESTVSVGAKKRDGAIKKVTSMQFRDIPVRCSDNSEGTIDVNLPKIRVRRNDFARKTPIEGKGIASGSVRVSGTFRRAGRRVKGSVRVSFEANSGPNCTTGKQRYKASK